MNDNRGFSLTQLLHDLCSSDRRIKKWQDLEQLVVELCKKQDPTAVHNTETAPDISLSVGIGIEAKSTTSMTRGINLNSEAPDPDTFYVFVYYRDSKIRNVAIVSGQNFYAPEIAEYQKINTSTRALSNKYLRVRTRVMWHVTSPFQIWGHGNFIVDKCGAVSRY